MPGRADPCDLELESLGVDLGGFSLRAVSLAIGKGEYHVLLGPTGSGKTSLIKCILGFHRPRSGRVLMGGEDITRLPPERRRMGYVPQNYALFPHLDVEGNIRFGMKARGLPSGESESLADRLAAMLDIDHLRGRKVDNLSGGERQKVALARALGAEPRMILLDEPFSSIDAGARRGLWFELRRAIAEVGITALHVTHNLDEAYTLGERVSVMIEGERAQTGPPGEVFARPASEQVAKYFNYGNIFRGAARPRPPGTRIELGHFSVFVGRELAPGAATVCVRQQDVKLIRDGKPIKESLSQNLFTGTVAAVMPFPEYCLVRFKMDKSPHDHDLEIKLPLHVALKHGLRVGKSIRVGIREPAIILF